MDKKTEKKELRKNTNELTDAALEQVSGGGTPQKAREVPEEIELK